MPDESFTIIALAAGTTIPEVRDAHYIPTGVTDTSKHQLLGSSKEVESTLTPRNSVIEPVGGNPPIPIPGANRFFVRDPDGNRIKLIQWKFHGDRSQYDFRN